ncbi:MAG: c-type cytochrome [Actinomycetota bacterium]|nr:c-type cytochrome [Actinomycetota bacterium]
MIAPRSVARWALAVPPVVGLATVAWSLGVPPAAAGTEQEAGAPSGAQLYATQCAWCHGIDGAGVEGRGPTLAAEGPAAVDFVLRTGRMPMADPNMQARRKRPRYTEAEIDALVDYAGAFGNGPAIPDVDPEDGDVAAGGRLYRLNCASCHVASGAGAAIGGGREAPDVLGASPTEIGEAILIGPGAMPSSNTFDDAALDDIAAYIGDLRRQGTTAARDFGGAGPVAEGLSAWLLGLVPLIALTRWIGSAHEGRDAALPDGADREDEP